MRMATLSLLAGVLAASCAFSRADQPTSTPAAATTTAPAGKAIPESVLKELEALSAMPANNMPREQAIAMILDNMHKLLAKGEQIAKDYPDAPNLPMVHAMMFQTAWMLDSHEQTPQSKQTLADVAQRILSSDAPLNSKVLPDFLLTLRKVQPEPTTQPTTEPTSAPAVAATPDAAATTTAPSVDAEIRAFVARYAGTPAETEATARATVLAVMTEHRALANELADVLEAKYKAEPAVQKLLQDIGRSDAVGKAFTAELTTVDGKKITLPDDLKGKVVLVDFWATWCGPCVREMPHMKEFYAKYKDKGVEIVGISLDEDKKQLTDYLAVEKLGWIITYTGQGWADPTARKYEVDSIPSVWAIGKDGKVLSTNALWQLEALVDEALLAPTTHPAAEPTSMPTAAVSGKEVPLIQPKIIIQDNNQMPE